MQEDFPDECLDSLQSATDIYTDVVVVGNGPSAIAVSYILSGQWPYYKGCGHVLEHLHCRLMQNESRSLVEQDLPMLCNGLEGRSNNPVSVLFDALNHPEADLGLNLPSVLRWVHDPTKALDHVVVGSGLPGGSWQSMEGSILTISLGSWMELPNLSYKEWESHQQRDKAGGSGSKQNRATVRSVAQYYYDYVQMQGLDKYFDSDAKVLSIRKFKNGFEESEKNPIWKVQGLKGKKGKEEPFSYVTSYVVLATGSYDRPNTLDISGEELPFVIHSLSCLEYLIRTKHLRPVSDPVVIVGAGLSAADAVITAHFYNIPVIHVFRRSVSDPELIFNKLPENMYPEYHKVHQMMHGKGEGYQGYTAFPSHRVVEIRSDHKVLLQGPDSTANITIQASYIVVLVGSWPDLSFLPQGGLHLGLVPGQPINCRDNRINIDVFSHECVAEPTVFAVGPLVGDNFVRFVQGGALAVANHLHKKLSFRN